MSVPVAVIGGGWAGMAAAVTLSGAGRVVCVFETARLLGGRARRIDLGERTLDNGQHILLGAYTQTLSLLRTVHGEGAAKIRWGQPNDFARCVEHLSKYIRDAKGYCNLAHHAALGIYPATHAAMEKHAGRAAMADTKKPYGDVKYADPRNGKYPLDT